MAILTFAEFGARSRASRDFTEEVFLGALALADKELKRWVGDTNYADPDNAEILKSAATYLTLYYGLPIVSLRLRTHGLVKTEQTESQEVRTLQYLTPEEMEHQQRKYYEMARVTLMAADLLVIDPPGSGFAIASGTMTDRETMTWQ